MHTILYIFFALFLAFPLSACGVKGNLKSPERIEEEAARKTAKEAKAAAKQQEKQEADQEIK